MIPRIYEPSETDFETNGLGVLKQCTRCHVYEGANGKYELELDHPTNTRFDEYFDNDYQIKAKPNDIDEYHIFTIYNKGINTYTDQVTVYAQSRTYKLGKRVVTKAAVDSATGQEAMSIIEANMDMESDVKLYSDITTVSSTTFEARNVLNCIAGEQGSLLQYWGGEIKREPFKLSLLKRRGRDNVGTVRYGKDLSGLKVTLDWQSLVTRIIPYADVQNAEGVAERIYGEQVDSELINNYPDVSTDFVQFTEEQGVKDLDSLNNKAKKYFKSINPGCDKPKINIEIQFEKLTDTDEAKEFARIRNYGLFDTFTVYHKRYKINLTSKVGGVKYDSLAEKTLTLEAGDGQTSFYQKQENMVTEQLKSYSSVNYMSQFADYVSSMITGGGQAGGHVVLWPKEQPSNILIMDTADINTAKQVIRLNKNGIAFSQTGWNGPFNSAWTIDSVFNADFIRTGKIIADVFETSFNALGDQLKLAAGALQAWNNGKKIMELTRRGTQFWNDNESIGLIGTKGDKFKGIALPDENYDGRSLFITLDSGGQIIQISALSQTGIQLDKNGNVIFKAANGKNVAIEGGDFIAGKSTFVGDVKVNSRLDVKELYVNGVKIDTNGSGAGGPSGGDLTIFVRVLALTAKYEMGDRSSGYYHEPLDDGAGWNYGKYSFTQVYEMTPFLAWLATNYPSIRNSLVGSVGTSEFNNSWAAYGAANETLFTGVQAEYFCRQKLKPMIEYLKSNTGVDLNDGNKWLGTLSIFSSILNWYPAAVQGGFFYRYVQQYASSWNDAGFIADVCDFAVANAADIVAPEYVAGIQNRFRAEKVDALALTTPTKIPFDTQAIGGYRIPIAKPITVSSEFGMRVHPITGVLQLHNGIDLVNGNPNTPILAANSGKVVQASGEYYDWYGNYVVIQHPDGLYTGYAHLSRIDVTAGQTVTAGQQLGLMGTTGPSTGEHLHFQFMKKFWPSGDSDFMNPREKISF